MRTAFIQELIRQARIHPRIFLVVGDLGYSVVEPFAEEFPDRFLNAGVAEQNMTSLAAGLASEGWHVFTYSIANFPTLRCLEQIRNDVCYHRLPVTVVAVGAGLAYGNLGFSHHGIHDIAALRPMPHLTLLSPADPGETRQSVRWLAQNPGPSYLRLGKAGEKTLHDLSEGIMNPLTVRHAAPGSPVALAATGSVLAVALKAADTLAARGCQIPVYSCACLKPADTTTFASLWAHAAIVTLEEHVLAGGFGSLLRELAPDGVRFRSLAVPETLTSVVGSQEYLRRQAGLTAETIVETVESLAFRSPRTGLSDDSQRPNPR
ncbi:MAG: transketolase family protein [Limisphaerales bacterium]